MSLCVNTIQRKKKIAACGNDAAFLAYVVIIQSRCYRFVSHITDLEMQRLLEGRHWWHRGCFQPARRLFPVWKYSAPRACVLACEHAGCRGRGFYKVLRTLVKMWTVLIISWSLALIAFKMWVACAVIVWPPGLDWHISLLTFYKLTLALKYPRVSSATHLQHYGGSFLQRLRYNGIKNSCRNSYILFFAFYWELLQQFSMLASNFAMKFVKYLNCSKVLWGRLQLTLPSSFQEKKLKENYVTFS